MFIMLERPAVDMHIIIVPPRVRTVLLGLPQTVRLAFPWLVFQEYHYKAGVSSAAQSVFASRERPTWDSQLYEFPLTWHHKTIGGYTKAIQTYSHINVMGNVCYDQPVLDSISRDLPQTTLQDAFWNSVYNNYDYAFVKEWAKLTKQDVAAAVELALRNEAPGTSCSLTTRLFPSLYVSPSGMYVRCPNITADIFPALATNHTVITPDEIKQICERLRVLKAQQFEADNKVLTKATA